MKDVGKEEEKMPFFLAGIGKNSYLCSG